MTLAPAPHVRPIYTRTVRAWENQWRFLVAIHAPANVSGLRFPSAGTYPDLVNDHLPIGSFVDAEADEVRLEIRVKACRRRPSRRAVSIA